MFIKVMLYLLDTCCPDTLHSFIYHGALKKNEKTNIATYLSMRQSYKILIFLIWFTEILRNVVTVIVVNILKTLIWRFQNQLTIFIAKSTKNLLPYIIFISRSAKLFMLGFILNTIGWIDLERYLKDDLIVRQLLE